MSVNILKNILRDVEHLEGQLDRANSAHYNLVMLGLTDKIGKILKCNPKSRDYEHLEACIAWALLDEILVLPDSSELYFYLSYRGEILSRPSPEDLKMALEYKTRGYSLNPRSYVLPDMTFKFFKPLTYSNLL